jgi:hypothetical protein
VCDLGRVVGEVDAVAGAHLEHPPGEPGEELAAPFAVAGILHPGADPGVEAGEERILDLGAGHGGLPRGVGLGEQSGGDQAASGGHRGDGHDRAPKTDDIGGDAGD